MGFVETESVPVKAQSQQAILRSEPLLVQRDRKNEPFMPHLYPYLSRSHTPDRNVHAATAGYGGEEVNGFHSIQLSTGKVRPRSQTAVYGSKC
jgi:hypothetical protein